MKLSLVAGITSAMACRQLRLLDGEGSGDGDGSFPSEAVRGSAAAARGTGLVLPSNWLESNDRPSSLDSGDRASTGPSKRGSLPIATAGELLSGASAGASLCFLASLLLRSSHEHTLKKFIGSQVRLNFDDDVTGMS
jgi:hypothetical protein